MTLFSGTVPTNHQAPGSSAEAVDPNKQRASRRPGVLSLASLSKRAPQVSTSTPPTTPPTHVTHNASQAVMQTDPSRLSQFSLRMNELLNKAFVASQCNVSSIAHSGTSPFTGTSISVPRIQNIVYGNNRLPNRVKVIEMTRLIIDELHNAERVDPYLLRAVSRTVLKTVSHFISRIESQLVSPRTDPTALQVPVSLRGAQHISPAMEFNLALISLEWIVEESLERCLEGLPPLALLHSPNILMPTAAEGMAKPPMPPFVHDILSPLREQMETSIIHVVQPLLVSVKSSITECLSRANPRPFQPQMTPPLLSKTDGSTEKRQTWHKELEERLDAAYRLLVLRIVDRCGQDGQAWFISVAIHIIWKGLLIITSRSVFAPASLVEAEFSHAFGRAPGSMPSSMVLNALLSVEHSKRVPTPTQLAHALRNVSRPSGQRKWQGESASGTQSPTMTSEDFESWSGQFALPATDVDCYVVNPLLVAEQLQDLHVFERLMLQFCTNFYPSVSYKHKRNTSTTETSASADVAGRAHPENGLSDDDGEEDLAHEALREAFEALQSTITVLRTLLHDPDALNHLTNDTDFENLLSPAAKQAFQMIPSLLLIQIAFCRVPPGWVGKGSAGSPGLQLMNDLFLTPPSIINYTWSQYESALPGFMAAEGAALSLSERYEPLVAQILAALDQLVEKVDQEHASSLQTKRSNSEPPSDDSNEDLPAVMTQSMPALDTGASEFHQPVSSANSKSSKMPPISTAMSSMTVDDKQTRNHRGHARTGTSFAPRLWRRHASQAPKSAMQHALPPRVSRAHATSSIGLPRGRSLHRTHQAGLPRSSNLTLAHMQRHALYTFANVVHRVPDMLSDS